MTIKFQYSGATTVKVINLAKGSLEEYLKPAVYRVAFNICAGFFLEKEYDSFKIPKKIYGNPTRKASKIIRTFNDRDRSTGILLTGDKGSGKTMLAEVVCNTLLGNGIPVVMITERFAGADFVSFVDSLGIIVLFFDEFGKTYPKSSDCEENQASQESLLALMDGGGRQKRLVIFTENQDDDINEYMQSRPGRVYYHFKYNKLEEETIKEFLQDQKSLEAEIVDYIVDASRKMSFFSFDILQAIVEEYTRYGGGLDGIEETLNDLNINYDKNTTIQLEVIKLIKKDTNEEEAISITSRYFNKPENSYSYIDIFKKEYDCVGRDNSNSNHQVSFRGSQLKYDTKNKFVYDNNEYILVAKISEKFQFSFNYAKM